MCRFCNTPKGKSRFAAYGRAADGCVVLANMLNGQPSPPSNRLTDAMEAFDHVQAFVSFEILDDDNRITIGKIRHEVLRMLNTYLHETDRQRVTDSLELLPTAQELVDMLATCREACENRTALDPYQSKEFAKRFRALGELIGKLHD